MADPRRVQLALAALAVAVVAVLGVRALRASGDGGTAPASLPTLRAQAPSATTSGASAAADGVEPMPGAAPASTPAAAPTAGTTTTQTLLVVHVAGAVRRPGVYDVRAGGRVVDAIRMAGGARRGGDPDALNLAAPVTDGQQVLVPRRGEPLAGGASAPGAGASPGAAATGGATSPASAGAAGAPATAPVDLNQATLEQLDALQGIGPALAQAILAYREAHGRFASIEDLGQVPGIGPARLETLRAGVRVG